ncbi:hypothetical protein [Neorhodopirellula lusitana]|uniref:hypothetical protein n=1 Tax=Neorhodopirellula lusitana TaxID=445327 RepID=UPI00384B53F5
MTEKKRTIEESREQLSRQLDLAVTLVDIRELFSIAFDSRAEVGFGYAVNVANTLCVAAASATQATPGVVAAIIESDLLPFIELENDDDDESPRFLIDQERLRENLRKWVYQYSHPEMQALRTDVLGVLQERIRTNPLKPHFWCVTRLGFRDSSMSELLWEIARSAGENCESAATALLATGLGEEELCEIFEMAEAQIDTNGGTHLAQIVVQDLVGPKRIEIAERLLRKALVGGSDEIGMGTGLAVAVATKAVDRCGDHDLVHDRIWSVLSQYQKIVNSSHEYGFRCNTSAVIDDHFAWLAEVPNEEDRKSNHWTYIYLSRLAEFVKPAHLEGWRKVDSTIVRQQLESIVTSNSGHRGQWATTTSKLKPDAFETLLAIEFKPTINFIEDAVVNESSAFVANDIAKRVACTEVSELPSSLLELVRSGVNSDEQDNEHFFRHTGFIELVQSCRSREAFDAISQFGFLYKDDVLLATIDAITETAIARIEEGDSDITTTLFELVKNGKTNHQREAAASVFCRLVWSGYIHGSLLGRLIDIVNDQSLKVFERGEALSAIGRSGFHLAADWKDQIWAFAETGKVAHGDDTTLMWRAIEVFILREWMNDEKYDWLFDRLGLSSATGFVQLQNADALAGWQAYLLGLLYERDVQQFSHAVASTFAHSKADVFYQLIRPVVRLGNANAKNVIDQFASRIESLNTSYSTDTGLFPVLAKLSPYSLLEMVESGEWKNWMVEGRTSLCEAVFIALVRETNVERRAFLIPFMQDSAFQVRRSAYRALADLDHKVLFSVCKLWTESGQMELERRAAESVEWLPTKSYPDDFVRQLRFQSHREPAVREAFKHVLIRRRQRTWADEYLEDLCSLCLSGNSGSAESFRLALALEKLGDDRTVQRIKEFVGEEGLPIWTRTLLKQTTKRIEKQWKQTTSKWPEPWSHEDGEIEEVDGSFVLEDGTEIDGRVSLWRKHRFDDSEKYSWGGLAVDLSGRFGFFSDDREICLQIPGRIDSNILIGNVQSTSHRGTEFRFNGQSKYPAKEQHVVADQEFFDQVVNVLDVAQLGVNDSQIETIAKRLQPLLEASDLSQILNAGDPREFADFRLQEIVSVVRIVADAIRETDREGVAIWRLTNRLVSTNFGELRLTPAELNEFASLAYQRGSNAEDEILIWMKRRLTPAERAYRPRKPLR